MTIQYEELRSHHRHKILICDDDIILCELLSIKLEQVKYKYSVVSTCADCLKAIKEEFYKVILLDNILPDGKGIDIIPAVRDISPNSKIIIMTGYGISEDKLFALNYGAGFIEKPFVAKNIISKLNLVLSE